MINLKFQYCFQLKVEITCEHLLPEKITFLLIMRHGYGALYYYYRLCFASFVIWAWYIHFHRLKEMN